MLTEFCGFTLADFTGDEVTDLGIDFVDAGVHAVDLGLLFAGTLATLGLFEFCSELLNDVEPFCVEDFNALANIHVLSSWES